MKLASRVLFPRNIIHCFNNTAANTLPAKGLMFLLLMLIASCSCAANCRISATPVSFGEYSPFDLTPLDSSGTISVRCSPGNTTYTVSLENGLRGSISNRRMTGSANNDQLNYNLYTDASRSIIWGDGSGNSQTVTRNSAQNLTVYGRIPPGQNSGVGSYSDSVTILIDF